MKRGVGRVVALGLLVGLAGCGSLAGRVVQAREAYTGVLSSLTVDRAGGKVDDATAAQIEGVRVEAARALDEAEERASAGDRAGCDEALGRFELALGQLAAWRGQVEKGSGQ